MHKAEEDQNFASELVIEESSRLNVRECDRWLLRALQQGGVGAWSWHIGTEVVDYTPIMGDILGLPPEGEQLGFLSLFSMIHPQDRDRVDAAIKNALLTGDPYQAEFRIVRDNGETRWVQAGADIEKDARGRPNYLTGTMRDITEQRRHREQFESIVQKTPHVAIQGYDRYGRVRFWNEASERQFGWSGEEATGKLLEEFLQTKEEADGIREVFRTILKTGEAYGPTEYPISKPDGSIGHCLSTIFLVSESADDPTFVCMDVDITDQKRLRDELESSRTKYSSLFHTAPDAIIIMDADSRNIIEVNDGFKVLTGFAPEEAEGMNPFDLGLWVNAEDRSRYMKLLEENNGSADYEGVFRRKDGSLFIGSLRSSVASLGEKKSLIVLARDVTDRTEAETQLRNKEERFRSIIEYSSDMIHILTQDGTLLYESPSANRILGFADDEPMAENALEFIHPDDLGHVLASLKQIIEYPELPARIECRVRMGNGEFLYIEAQARNLLNEPGIQGIVINSRDISDRRLAERRMAQQLERLKALRAIDMAISGSLDLKVTLNVVLSETMTQLKATAAMVRILRPDSCMLEIASEHGVSDYYESGPLHIGSGLAGRAVTENRVLQLESNQPGDMGLEMNTKGTGKYLHVAAPLVAKGRPNGVLEVWVEKSQVGDAQWFAFLEMLAGQTAIAVDNVMMFEEIQRSNLDLVVAYDATIEGWSKALELRDKETEGHTKRVTELSVALSRQMGLSESELVQVRRGALLHDIGKMGVPDEILLKPDKLTVEEFDKMKKHTEYAHEWLASIPFLRHAIEIPYCHHEKWDGTGYPQGLREEHIPLTARIFAIVDVWDALTSDRPYKRAMDPDEALAYILNQSGKHFDPEVVRAFEKLIQPRIAKSKAA